ncbi:MAG TPA: DEAD/DEAH box helicase family protein [Methanocellales archaeon]|nr:DEAD/DEAH box helicase family protein [Methanocellales archaeon]
MGRAAKNILDPPQESILKEWYKNLREQKDIIVKLHTGQGKTLIGLLMLQSSINEGKGPAVYLCPNNYLVTQTTDQAHSFGGLKQYNLQKILQGSLKSF